MFRHLLLTAVALTPVLSAQSKTVAFAQPGDRASANLFIATMNGSEFGGVVGAAFINYGAPAWKAEWNDQAALDKETKGKIFRLGKDNWATLDTSLPMTIGTAKIPAGVYYMAMARDAKDAWNLVFIDPAKCKAANAWPFMPDAAPRAFEVTMKHEMTKETQPKLTMNFVSDPADPYAGTLAVHWGTHKVTTPYKAEGKAMKTDDAAAKKDEKADKKEEKKEEKKN